MAETPVIFMKGTCIIFWMTSATFPLPINEIPSKPSFILNEKKETLRYINKHHKIYLPIIDIQLVLVHDLSDIKKKYNFCSTTRRRKK